MIPETKETVTKISEVWKKRPMIISGPCSAETEEQVLTSARQLAATGVVDVMRAGIWKPRTKPGSFEGVGVKGLPWLIKAKEETGLLMATEVATAKHVEDALSFGVDILWIGSRTTVNPFSVQEIADALRGTEVPVLVKNPINPDVELWTGGIQRMIKAGVKNIGMIHRGFSSYGNTQFRNAPIWRLPIEMKRRYPDMPLICDPSHICGNRTDLLAISQTGIDLDFGGLMIESHPDPDNAWSDAQQQITPTELKKMLQSIQWRKESTEEESYLTALAQLREQINQMDDELLTLIAQRMVVSQKIGAYKKENNIAILQTGRWNEVLERVIAKGNKMGLSEKFITKYFDAIHLESISHQKKILNG